MNKANCVNKSIYVCTYIHNGNMTQIDSKGILALKETYKKDPKRHTLIATLKSISGMQTTYTLHISKGYGLTVCGKQLVDYDVIESEYDYELLGPKFIETNTCKRCKRLSK